MYDGLDTVCIPSACRVAAGRWAPGEPDIGSVTDAGYDVTQPARVPRDLPAELVLVRNHEVMGLTTQPRVYAPRGDRTPHRGPEFRFAMPERRHLGSRSIRTAGR
ncbi:hypothetical protein ACFQ77_10145 [Streptomyces virginiae]|uniref:hypothetical protein n=1 Tax=Streptomyces virginiae TaxID=1961 RepID=UPI003691CAAC